MKTSTPKLFLVTRSDLRPCQQAVQAAHSLREFVACYGDIDKQWYETSNTLSLKAVKDEQSLKDLLMKARELGLPAAPFTEPDMNDALTAVAFSPECKSILSKIPLALQLCENPV